MKILFLAPYAPYPPRGGGQQRMYQMLRLVAEQHDVHLLTFVANRESAAALAPLRAFCTVHTIQAPVHSIERRLRTLLTSTVPDMALRGSDEQFVQALRYLLESAQFDVVQAESIEMVQYGRLKSSSERSPLWVYDAFNAEYLIQRRAFLTDIGSIRRMPVAAYSLIQWLKLRAYEQSLARRFDLALTVSLDDQAHLGRLAPGLASAVVPNGVDIEFFQAADAPETEPMVLFTGTLDYRPNIDAVSWFVREVWPVLHAKRPTLRFSVVGQRPTPELRELGRVPGVEIVGPVDDIRPWFGRSVIYVLPMRVGGGVRLKLLETWSMQVPCVTTTMGAEGVAGFVAGDHALIADDVQSFARQVERLLDDPLERLRIARAGRALVTERYEWRSIVAHMVEVWKRHIE